MARNTPHAEKPAPSKTDERAPASDPPQTDRKPARPAPDFVFDDWASI